VPHTRRTPALAAAVAALAMALSVLAAPGATAGRYTPRDVPHTDTFRDSGPVFIGNRTGSAITVREARAVKVLTMRFDVVRHAGERSARIRTTLKGVLPPRPQRYEQLLEVSFDEERALVTDVGTGRTRFVSGYGGGPLPGCHRQSSRRDGRVLTQWVPLRCLVTDTSEMGTRSTLSSVRTGREVGVHGRTLGFGPFLRWRG
jgi:hypothetical protein